MFETAVLAFTTLFATVGPIDVAVMYAALSADCSPARRRAMALRGTLVATLILLFFALFGRTMLDHLGISLAALRTAGGILLLLIAIDMVFARNSGGVSTTDDEYREAAEKEDLSVFPLATPLIAGPGAMGAVLLLMANTGGQPQLQMVVLLTLGAMMLITLAALLGANQLQKVIGVTGLYVISRVFGMILAALAVQFIIDGIGQSGLLQMLQDSPAP
jgi:multiple antibiotic resistance protein